MKRKIMITVIFAVFVSAFMMLTTLSGCTGKKTSSESAASSEVVSSAGRQDGERFEEVIQLEGMDETVRYEHVRNETAGFELDYDYEQLDRRGEPSHEQFVSRFDDPEKPENYIEVIFRSEDADTVSKAVKADLSKKYGKVIVEEQYMLDRAGSCVQISASEAKKKRPLSTHWKPSISSLHPTAVSSPRHTAPSKVRKASGQDLPISSTPSLSLTNSFDKSCSK